MTKTAGCVGGTTRVLITCPPMLGRINEFIPRFQRARVEISLPSVVQTLSVPELVALVPEHDGWIIGDDPATKEVFSAGKAGRLRAAMKWGVGVDNVDFTAAKECQIQIANTPNMFGTEVADVATCYVIGLARSLFVIDRQVRQGQWPKPAGMSLQGKTVGLIGYGDVGRNVARRLAALDMSVIVYDPILIGDGTDCEFPCQTWPDAIAQADFLIFTCALTPQNLHMLNAETLKLAKQGVRIVNVARGPLIDEAALVEALSTGRVAAAALDVFEEEPLPKESPLRRFDQCIFGTHNGSNTQEAVRRASEMAIDRLFEFLGIK